MRPIAKVKTVVHKPAIDALAKNDPMKCAQAINAMLARSIRINTIPVDVVTKSISPKRIEETITPGV